MERRSKEIHSFEYSISSPNFQITSHAVTKASLLKRLKEVRLAVEEWQQSTRNQKNGHGFGKNVPQPAPDTDHLAAAFVNHLSEAQDTLSEAEQKLKQAIEASRLAYEHKTPT